MRLHAPPSPYPPPVDDFVVARNPDPDSALPYLLRLPLPRPVVLKARDTWPRTAKVYCHRADGLAGGRRGRRAGARYGPAPRAAPRSTWSSTAAARTAASWCSPGSRAGARRSSGRRRAPTTQGAARGAYADRPGERAGAARDRRGQRGSATRTGSPRSRPRRCAARCAAATTACGATARLVAAVERKSLEDLARSLVDGRLPAQLAELATLPHAAVVVEERYSRLFTLPFVKPGFVADLLARVQVRWPTVPVFFAETRPLAEEWTYRFLAAAVSESRRRRAGRAAAGRPGRGGGARRPRRRRPRRCGPGRGRRASRCRTAGGCRGRCSWRTRRRTRARGAHAVSDADR